MSTAKLCGQGLAARKHSPRHRALGLLLVLAASCFNVPAQNLFSHFAGLTNFDEFVGSTNSHGDAVWLSPQLRTAADWNELIVSWNADAPPGTWLKIEASAEWPDHDTKFYVLGRWTPDDVAFPRASVPHQGDADGDVLEDTLCLKQLANTLQVRLTLGATNGILPRLKFLGLSFCNTNAAAAPASTNQAAWGKIIPTPERSQKGYTNGNGWCSPTSLSMDLARWADVLKRPELDHDVPTTAAGVCDHAAHDATGDWPFNTAFAGSLPGMRAYVTRFRDLSELEDWVAAGIPVIISARWDLLEDGRPEDLAGHLSVCIGFTDTGDVVINDPATSVKTPEVRRIYKRANVQRAWATSHNTVYLVYPENSPVPANRLGDWYNTAPEP